MKRPKLGSAVYILPNLFTTGNLFFGFFSIIKCLNGDYRWAASALLLAAVFDVLDGRVARLTGGTSEFGVQYDSLCDLVSFGLAPAFLAFKFGLNDAGRLGWIFCFLFLACGALRLARFNVQSSIGKGSGDFTGLPIPMAAAVIATYVAVSMELQSASLDDIGIQWKAYVADLFRRQHFNLGFLLTVVPLLSMAMVSNIAYRSHKMLRFTLIKPFRMLVLLTGSIALIAYEPELFGFVLVASYALSGPFEWVLGWKKPIDEYDIFEAHEEHDSMFEPKDKEKMGGP